MNINYILKCIQTLGSIGGLAYFISIYKAWKNRPRIKVDLLDLQPKDQFYIQLINLGEETLIVKDMVKLTALHDRGKKIRCYGLIDGYDNRILKPQEIKFVPFIFSNIDLSQMRFIVLRITGYKGLFPAKIRIEHWRCYYATNVVKFYSNYLRYKYFGKEK